MRRVRAAPTLLTLGNLVSGFGSLTMSTRAISEDGARQGRFLEYAVLLVALAMLFDLLDGRVARLTGLTSRFGAELDSLADVVSFGVAPAALGKVLLGLGGLPMWAQRAGWAMLALYVAATAVRLARYNVEAVSVEDGSISSKGKEYFTGLPSPAAAGLAVSPVLFYCWLIEQQTSSSITRLFTMALPVLMLALALLMISRVRYLHLGNWLSGRRQKLIPVMLLIGVLVLAGGFPHLVPMMAVGAYVVGGLAWDLSWRVSNARARRRLSGAGGPGTPATPGTAGQG